MTKLYNPETRQTTDVNVGKEIFQLRTAGWVVVEGVPVEHWADKGRDELELDEAGSLKYHSS